MNTPGKKKEALAAVCSRGWGQGGRPEVPLEGKSYRLTHRDSGLFDFELRYHNRYMTEIGIRFSNGMSLPSLDQSGLSGSEF